MSHRSATHATALSLAAALALGGAVRAQAGANTCPDGSDALVLQVQGCYPPDCTSLQLLDWGTGGVPPVSISVDKFPSALGTLLEVELEFKARFVGSGCIDNDSPACMQAQLSVSLLSLLTSSALNVPPVTGFVFGQLSDSTQITPQGFLLGGSDGFDDCGASGPKGSPSIGDCTTGEDHFSFSFSENYSVPFGSLTGSDLAPWIGAVGSRVTFDSMATGMASGFPVTALGPNFSSAARVWIEVTYRYCPSTAAVGSAFCTCEVSSPCGNAGGPGEGCANGTGAGAILSGVGSASLSAANLVLYGEQLPANQPALFFQGDSAVAGGLGTLFGDGLRCAGGTIVRLAVAFADAGGGVATSTDLGLVGGAAAGDVRRYQLWYRDPTGSPCGNSFNLSNGLELTWLP